MAPSSAAANVARWRRKSDAVSLRGDDAHDAPGLRQRGTGESCREAKRDAELAVEDPRQA